MAAQGHSVEVRDGCAGLIFDAEWLLRSSVPRGRRGVLVLAAAGGREAGGESGHCLVCGSGEEIRRVERSGRGQSLLGSVKSSIIIYTLVHSRRSASYSRDHRQSRRALLIWG